jgi:hypothetical protein
MGILENGEEKDRTLIERYKMMKEKEKDITYIFENIEHESSFEYNKYEINETSVERLKKLEKVIKGAIDNLKVNAKYLSKALHEANLILPKDGTFGEWCKNMNLSKDDVSLFYKKEQFAEQFALSFEEVEMVPQVIIKEATKKKTEFNKEEIAEIILSAEPYRSYVEKKKEKIFRLQSKNKNKVISKNEILEYIERVRYIQEIKTEEIYNEIVKKIKEQEL